MAVVRSMMLEFPDRDYRRVVRIGERKYAACAPAKLNITLDIGKREDDGMHNISSVMQTISLHDYVTLEVVDAAQVGITGQSIDDNVITKAIDELSRAVGKKLHCRIDAPKNIPVAAGLGGGSSDAAAALRLADKAFDLQMGASALATVAERVGNDIPFLLYAGRAQVKGAKKHAIRPMNVPSLYYIMARPRMQLGTREMYELHDKTGKDFTEIACMLCPDTDRILKELKRTTAVETGVTGKGPTVFASYASYGECVKAARQIGWFDGEVFIEKPVEAFIY